MYNKQLDAFIHAAETGSFTKAAKQLYIAPASLIQQINTLETHLGLTLFERGPRGVTLTDQGQSLYQDAIELMRSSDAAIRRAKAIQEGKTATIRIGTNLLMKCRYLMNQCARLVDEHPEITIELVSVKSPDDTEWKPLRGLGIEYDMHEGLYLSEFYRDKCGFLELDPVPLCPAFPSGHRLLDKKVVKLEDLSGETVVLQERGISRDFDKLRDELERIPGITFFDVHHYSVHAFAQCELQKYVLFTPMIWADLHPGLEIRPLASGHTIRYGIMHTPNPSKQAKMLLSLIEKMRQAQ